jgi:hypothetical protein
MYKGKLLYEKRDNSGGLWIGDVTCEQLPRNGEVYRFMDRNSHSSSLTIESVYIMENGLITFVSRYHRGYLKLEDDQNKDRIKSIWE